MRKILTVAAAALACLADPALAQSLSNPNVSAVNPYSGDLSVLTDGVIPADGSVYNGPDKVTFDTALFMFQFGGVYSIDGLLANVDNNDNYYFDFFNGGAFVGEFSILAGEGSVTNGVETFTRSFSPFLADTAIVWADGGDRLNAIGEVQFRSSALSAAVPEPATWAMMLLGFGGIGFAMRRQRRLSLGIA